MSLLSGITVLDASHVIAGPFATYQLALMGAEVIRVERIGGDDFVRHHGGTEAMRRAGLGASFVSQNAGKRCIQIDLKTAPGVAVFKRLAARADVVVENFRPGVMDRLGLGYAAIRAVNADIVYCSLTGFGPEGPLRDAPAYDHIVQGISGMMSMTGTPESGPLRVGMPITDYIAGLNAALAIVAAVRAREQGAGGRHLQVSMLASVLAVMGAHAVDWQTAGGRRGLEGNRPFSGSPFAGRFDTADGYLVVTANTAAQGRRLAALLDRPELEPFAERMARAEPIDAAGMARAEEILSDAFRAETALVWEARLAEAAIPAAKVRDLAETLAHPQTAAAGGLERVPVGIDDLVVDVPGLGFRVAGEVSPPRPAPERLGQSTLAVLDAAGIDAGERARLAAAGVIAGPGLGADGET